MKITAYKKKDGKTYYMAKGYLGIDNTGKKCHVTRRGFLSRVDARSAFFDAQQEFEIKVKTPKEAIVSRILCKVQPRHA